MVNLLAIYNQIHYKTTTFLLFNLSTVFVRFSPLPAPYCAVFTCPGSVKEPGWVTRDRLKKTRQDIERKAEGNAEVMKGRPAVDLCPDNLSGRCASLTVETKKIKGKIFLFVSNWNNKPDVYRFLTSCFSCFCKPKVVVESPCLFVTAHLSHSPWRMQVQSTPCRCFPTRRHGVS